MSEQAQNEAGNEGSSVTVALPDEGCLKFLRALARWQGVASPQDLGPQTSQDENRARQKCKRRGWVTYDGGNVGYWRLTDAGREALRSRVVPVRP